MDWTVDYGDGPQPCTVPHCWRQDVDVRWEGPAVYRTEVAVHEPGQWLVFHGVSYHARVFLDDTLACEHLGIWDGFAVPLPGVQGKVQVRVEVVKNGGPTFPVKDVLSGFLPYVYHTFGGIFRDVEVAERDSFEGSLDRDPAPDPRIAVTGTRLSIDGNPWTMRGVLSWGWYPETGSPHPSIEIVRDEVRRVKALGFNLVKFCLWLPPHHYFQVLEEEDMWAWVELPLWLPSENIDLDAVFAECERIVRQYRHHDRIVCWTCGCELSTSTPHEFRKRLFEMVRDLTGCPLVKDNSGGAEMYGGDLREYGTFYDFHPYCDTMFYPPVLESLAIGPRKKMPILLGEFNDYDVYRPIGPLLEDTPYWASSDPAMNDQGVRWQHDLPGVLARGATQLNEESLRERSIWQARRLRKRVHSAVAAQADIAGYVVTGLADTPISTSGLLSLPEGKPWKFGTNLGPGEFFILPFRRPPWRAGGNQPGWSDTQCLFDEATQLLIGFRSDRALTGRFTARWTPGFSAPFECEVEVAANTPTVIAELPVEPAFGGCVELFMAIDSDGKEIAADYTDFLVTSRLTANDTGSWLLPVACPIDGVGTSTRKPETVPPDASTMDDPDTGRSVVFLSRTGTLEMPFWRECVRQRAPHSPWIDFEPFLFSVAADRAIDPAWLDSTFPGAEWLTTRVDTRTYARHPYIARHGDTVVTTLRPWGGLGAQPANFQNNPAGHELLRILMRLTEGR